MPTHNLANPESRPEQTADRHGVRPDVEPDVQSGEQRSPRWRVEVFFDGDCPLCRREINWLRKRDRDELVKFTDIAAPSFEATILGKTQDELMARIHGRLPDGTWIEGVEVFRQLYAAVGLGWLVAPTRLPLVRQLLDLGYRIFARFRLLLPGRCESGKCSTGLAPTPSSEPALPPAKTTD